MQRLIRTSRDARAVARGFRSFGLVALLTLSVLFAPAPPVGAGDATVEIPIPAAVEKGLEQAGIRIETRRSWLDNTTLWVAGGIIVAGLIIAYAIRRKK